jgi:Retinal pigment epithelial membrane protein
MSASICSRTHPCPFQSQFNVSFCSSVMPMSVAIPFSHMHVEPQSCRFDGEAMMHAISFSNGQARSYTNHWLRCKRYLYEKAAGTPLYLRVRTVPTTCTACAGGMLHA